MPKFLVTAEAEYYQFIDADSEAEALEKSKTVKDWYRTINSPLKNIKAEECQLELFGAEMVPEESKEQSPAMTPFEILEKLKEQMWEAGYTSFSITESKYPDEYQCTLLTTQVIMVKDDKPALWSIADSLGLTRNGTLAGGHLFQRLSMKLPNGTYYKSPHNKWTDK